MRDARGFALIAVLWLLVLIAAISSYLVAKARQETAIARNIVAAAKAEALADAGVAQAIFNQLNPVRSARWALDGTPHVIAHPGGELTIRLLDEDQKINPNRASESLLAGLFEAAGIERPLARRLGASVADWIDRDAEPRPLGAERQHYADAGRTYAPPNMPIESLDELQLVLGLTPQVYALVRPYLTIHSNAERPDGRNAPPVVQRTLALASASPPNALGTLGSEMAAERELTADERAALEAQEAQAEEEAQVPDLAIIALQVTARATGGGVFFREAIVRIDPRSPKGYVVLDWQRGELGQS